MSVERAVNEAVADAIEKVLVVVYRSQVTVVTDRAR